MMLYTIAVAEIFYTTVWRKLHKSKPSAFLSEDKVLLLLSVDNNEEAAK